MNIVCACIYAAIIAVFCIGYSNSGSLNIGNWLYAMLVLFGTNVAYCIYMIMIEMRKRKKMLELMTGGDMLPYVRYARASVFALFFSTLTMPFVILSTTLLYNRTIGSTLYPFLQPEFRGIGLQLRSYRGTLG